MRVPLAAVAFALNLSLTGCCGDLFQFGGCSCDLSGGCSDGSSNAFEASLTGNSVVPPVSTTASGTATFELNPNESAAAYSITVANLSTAESAKLYTGVTGQNGTERVTLCAPCTTAGSNVLASGTANVTPAIVSGMRAFGAYVEISTTAGPLLRGQLRIVGR